MLTSTTLPDGSVQLTVTPDPGPKGDPGPPGPTGRGASTPGGRLTLVRGTPEMPQTEDYSSTTLYYAPFESDMVPLFDGTNWGAYPFASGPLDVVGLSMAGGAVWAANTQRDVFLTLIDGVPALCTGPAWPGESMSSRGLVRRSGLWVNAADITCALAATATTVVPTNQATWVGAINVGATEGLLTATFTLGQNRRCDVWNVYHQREIRLGVGCPPASPTTPVVYKPQNSYTTGYLAFNNDINNSGYYFTGLPQHVVCDYRQTGFLNTYGYGAGAAIITVCKDTLANPTEWGNVSSDQESATTGYAMGNYKIQSVMVDRSSVGSHRAIMGTAGANHYNGVDMHGLDPRTALGSLYRAHVMWITYQG